MDLKDLIFKYMFYLHCVTQNNMDIYFDVKHFKYYIY